MRGLTNCPTVSLIKILGCILAILALAAPCPAGDRTITWMTADFPPVSIPEGPLKGQGYGDVIQKAIQDRMPEYTHESLLGNMNRLYHEYRQGQPVCSVSLYKTPERKDFIYFSIPSTFTLPNRLILRAEDAEGIEETESISLATVLDEGEIRLGIAANRSYGRPLDTVLDRHRKTGKLHIYVGDDLFENLLRMLVAGRLDAILGLPEEVMFVAEGLGVREAIVSVALTETLDDPRAWMGYVGCSRTDWGRAVIDSVNRALRDARPTAEYRRAYERWLDAEGKGIYRRLYDQVFLSSDDS